MIEITAENFDEKILKSDKPVLVDFFATWCGPCKAMHPVLEELDDEAADFLVGKIDVDRNPELTTRYRIMSVPTFMAFKDGKPVNKAVGMQDKSELLSLLEG